MSQLFLSFLGPFQTRRDGVLIGNFKSSSVRALLAYMAVEAHRPHSREVLADLLWPERDRETALGYLRSILADLRKVIGDREATPPFLLIERECIQFNQASDYWLDVVALVDGIAAAMDASRPDLMEKTLALYHGPFLEGFSLCGAPAFEEWLMLHRERYVQDLLAGLHWLVSYYKSQGEYMQARRCLQQQLQVEPWQEKTHLQLMRLFAVDGCREAALTQYQTCRRVLAEEFGVEPTAETTALYQALRQGAFSGQDETTRRHQAALLRFPPPGYAAPSCRAAFCGT